MSYLAYGYRGYKRAYTYKVTVPPTNLPITLEQVKEQLRITTDDDDALLTIYIEAATDYAENFTRKDFITRTYETFRDFFPSFIPGYGCYSPYSFSTGNVGFQIRRSPLQSIEQIQYLSGGIFIIVDSSIYYNTLQTDYSSVLTNQDNQWPTDVDERLQSIVITFKSGFGDTDADVPIDIQVALMQIVAALYENRGDCSSSLCGGQDCAKFAPATAMAILKQHRIENL